MRIALWQTSPVPADPAVGLERLETAAAAASEAGAALLVTPEMVLTGYAIGAARAREHARPRGGEYHERVAAIARNNDIAIAFGYPEDHNGEIRNAAALIAAEGVTLADYAKTHLFGAIDHSQFTPGEALSPVVELEGWRVALAICYDIEFPEVARSLALGGADLILVPTADMEPYSSVPMKMVPTRAEENGVFVAYANYCGAEGDIRYCALSCVAGPDGADMARAGRGEELLVADLDRGAIARRHRAIHYLADRRPELYRTRP